MGLGDRLKRAIQIVVGGHSVGRTVVKGATINGGAYRPKQGEEWLHAYNTMPWLRANVAKIAGGVAGLEWGITRTMDENGMTVKRPDLQRGTYEYRKKVLAAMEDEEKAEATFDHPFLSLLKNPCPALPGKAALILAQVYYEIVGEVFFVVDRGSRDEWLLKSKVGRPLPTALWPIPPTWVKRIPTPDNPTFEIRQSGLQMNDIPLTEVLWLKNPDPVNPYARGVGLFNSLTDELDSDENAAKMISYSFYNRNRPDVLVTLPDADEVELRAFRNDWISNLQGVSNALKNHFVNVNAEVHQLGYDFREMQVIDLRRHTRDTIRQVPGMPPEILGIQDQSNRATIDAAEYIFAKHVVVPRAEIWRDFWQTQVVVEYDDRAILDYVTPVQEDKNFTLNIVTGRPEVVKVNEVRKLGGLPALTDEEGGNLFFVNGSFVPTLAPPAGPPMPGAEAGAGLGISVPGFEGGINVPGAPQMHLSVPGAAGSAESGLPAPVGAPQGPPGGNPPPAPGSPSGGPPAPPAPDGNGPGYTLAGRPEPKDEEDQFKGVRRVTKIHNPHVVDEGDGTFKVIDDDGKVYGTHDTEDGAEAQVRALFAAKKRKGVAVRSAARNFRPLLAEARVASPDAAILISKWLAENAGDLDTGAVVKSAPIPVCDHRPTEWVRRAIAFVSDRPTGAWEPMFGPWSDADTKILDSLLVEKGDYEGHPFRGNQWTTGQGEERDREVEEMRRRGSINANKDDEQEKARIGGYADKLARIGEINKERASVQAEIDANRLASRAITDEKFKALSAELTAKREANAACGAAYRDYMTLTRDIDGGIWGRKAIPDDEELKAGKLFDGTPIPKEIIAATLAYRATQDASQAADEAWNAASMKFDLRPGGGNDIATQGQLLRDKMYELDREMHTITREIRQARLEAGEKLTNAGRAVQTEGVEAREPRNTAATAEVPIHPDSEKLMEASRDKFGRARLGPGEKLTPGFEATIKDAKDFKEKMTKMYPGMEVEGVPRDADMHVLTQIHDEFRALRDEYPEVAVRAIKLNAGGMRATAWGGGEDKITFGKLAVRSWSDATMGFGSGKRRTSDDEMPEFHDGVRSFASVARHEFAHQLHFQHPQLQADFNARINALPSSDRVRVTGYALKNRNEMFAEAFTCLKYGDDVTKRNPVVRALDEALKDYFSKIRRKP